MTISKNTIAIIITAVAMAIVVLGSVFLPRAFRPLLGFIVYANGYQCYWLGRKGL